MALPTVTSISSEDRAVVFRGKAARKCLFIARLLEDFPAIDVGDISISNIDNHTLNLVRVFSKHHQSTDFTSMYYSSRFYLFGERISLSSVQGCAWDE